VSVVGRWDGNWYEWGCPSCGDALTALQAPPPDKEHCPRCRLASERAALDRWSEQLIDRLATEIDEWKERALKAERENERLKQRLGGEAA